MGATTDTSVPAATAERHVALPAEGARKRKLGEKVAARILADIIQQGWKEGENLGTEKELMAHYGVSRATLREAIRQVERHGAAAMRRGAGGGLLVSAPPRDAAVRAIITFLEFSRISFHEQHEVREQLERTIARLASERITPDGAEHLSALVDELQQAEDIAGNITGNMKIRVAVAQATGNPSLPLFIEALNGVLRDILAVLQVDQRDFQRDRELSVLFKRELVNAIVARDGERADLLVQHDVRRRLVAMTSLMTAAATGTMESGQRLPGWSEAAERTQKLSEKIASRIVADIARTGWQAGLNLGTEVALQQRYSVSRAVLREALRQLELLGIAQVKSGVQGGVIIGRVDPSYTIDLVKTYLHSSRIKMIHLWETQSCLEIYAVTQLAQMATGADMEALDRHIRRMEQAKPDDFLTTASALHDEIAERAGNRALALFIHILVNYGLDELPPVDPIRIPWLMRAHMNIVAAIKAHDVGLAKAETLQLFLHSRRWVNGQL